MKVKFEVGDLVEVFVHTAAFSACGCRLHGQMFASEIVGTITKDFAIVIEKCEPGETHHGQAGVRMCNVISPNAAGWILSARVIRVIASYRSETV